MDSFGLLPEILWRKENKGSLEKYIPRIILDHANKNNISEEKIIIFDDLRELPLHIQNKIISKKPRTIFDDFVEELADKYGVTCPELLVCEADNFKGLCCYDRTNKSAYIFVGAPYNALSTEVIKAVIAHEFFHYLQFTRGVETCSHEQEFLADSFAAREVSRNAVLGFLNYAEKYHPETRIDTDTHPSNAKRMTAVLIADSVEHPVTWLNRVSESRQSFASQLENSR